MAKEEVELHDLNDAVGQVVRWKARGFWGLFGDVYLEDTQGRAYAVYHYFWRGGGTLRTSTGEYVHGHVRSWPTTKATIRSSNDEEMLGEVLVYGGSADRDFVLGGDTFAVRTVESGIIYPTMAIYHGGDELMRSKWNMPEVEITGQHPMLAVLAAMLKWIQKMAD